MSWQVNDIEFGSSYKERNGLKAALFITKSMPKI
jgi:hypothetical protein